MLKYQIQYKRATCPNFLRTLIPIRIEIDYKKSIIFNC